MIIFLFGPDGFRLKTSVKKVVESYKAKHKSGFNFFNFDLEENGAVVKMEDAIKSVSFFDEVKLIQVNDLFDDERQQEKLSELIVNFKLESNKDIVLMVSENKTKEELEKKNKKLFKFLSEKANPVREFVFLKGSKLEDWLKMEFKSRGFIIESSALKKLISLAGSDSWALNNEIVKLCNYQNKNKITLDDVNLLVAEKIDLNIFDFVDAVGSNSKTRAFEFLFKEIASGRDPYYILTMIVYQFRNLLMVKDLLSRKLATKDIAKKSGLHPFVVQKTSQSANKFNLDELKRLYTKLLEIDISTKLGQGDLTDYLYNFILAG